MSFKFKRFEICDTHCAQKVGTDGVLLGAWVNVDGVNSILDVGAGSGLISLMLAQRTENSDCLITGVELDKDAAADCKYNMESSPWADRLSVDNKDFEQIEGQFDLIISNPPFFTGDLAAAGTSRMLARQGISLNYFTLIEFAAKHLTAKGRLAFTSDMRHESAIVYTAEINRLSLSRICRVSGKEGREPVRLLWEFSKGKETLESKEFLSHRNADGSYHKDYIGLTRDFYLKL